MKSTTEALVEDIINRSEEYDVQALLEALAIAKDLGIYVSPTADIRAKEAQVNA